MVHGFVNLAIRDPHRPGRTLRRAKLGALLTVALLLAFAATFRLGSGADTTNAEMIEGLVGLSLWCLAGFAGVAAAFCSVTALTHFSDAWNGRQISRLELLLDKYEHHTAELNRDVEALSRDASSRAAGTAVGLSTPDSETRGTRENSTSPPAPAVPSDPRRPVPTSTASHAAILILSITALAGQACAYDRETAAQHLTLRERIVEASLPARTAGIATASDDTRDTTPATLETAAPKGAAAAAGSLVPAGSCEILIDTSSSTHDESRHAAVSAVMTALPDLTQSLACSVLRVAPFSGDAYEPLWETTLAPLSDPGADCALQARQPAPTGGTSRLVEAVYPVMAEARSRRAAETCLAAQRAQASLTLAARDRALAEAGQRLLAVQDGPPRGHCTALNEVAARALRRSQGVVVITDGWSSCPSGPRAPAGEDSTLGLPVPTTSLLLFALVPSKTNSDERGAEADIREANLERVFPGSRTYLFNELTPTFWRLAAPRLLHEPQSR